MTRFWRILLNVALLCITVLIIILLMEWFLRISNIQRVVALNPPIYRRSDDAILSYELIPSVKAPAYGETVTTNDIGLRAPPLKKDAASIAVLGDSLAFGFGVKDDQSIPAHLQTQLSEYQIVNGGVNGYNIDQETEQYKTKIAAFRPKATILMFNFNDFDETFKLDNEGFFQPRSATGTLTYTQRLDTLLHKPGTLPIPFKAFLQTHSAVFNLIVRVSKNFRAHPPESANTEDPITDAQLQKYAASLLKLTKMLGTQPKLFIIWPEALKHEHSRQVLKQTATEQGWKVLDFYDIYGNTYPSLGWDGHPDNQTNTKTAEVIAQTLIAWKLLP